MKSFSLIISVILIVATQAIEHKDHKEYHHIDEYAPPAYEFHYAVHDPHTGDIKSQKETRKDDKVEGSYELIDSDGHHRIVHYKADHHNGFEAVVVRKPTHIKIPEHHEHHHDDHHEHKYISHAPIVHYGHKGESHHNYY